MRAFRSLRFFRGGSFEGWLRRILVHLARDRYRAQGRRPEPVLLERESVGREPHESLEERELARLVADALLALPEPQRLALSLRTREGLEYDEIAAQTGVTAETARTRVMKARRGLLRILGPYLAVPDTEAAPRRGP